MTRTPTIPGADMPRLVSVALSVVVACGGLATFGVNAGAQGRAEDETVIRAIIAKMNAGEPPVDIKNFRPHEIFWSGAMVRPQVGSEKPHFRPGSSGDGGGEPMRASQVQIVQLHLSSSGNMAHVTSRAGSPD